MCKIVISLAMDSTSRGRRNIQNGIPGDSAAEEIKHGT